MVGADDVALHGVRVGARAGPELLEEGRVRGPADELLHLLDTWDALVEDNDITGADIQYSQGVLEVDLGNKGTYVLNKQAPNKQIWMSSPLSGPLRYDYDPASGVWVYARDGHGLRAKLSAEVESLLGLSVEF